MTPFLRPLAPALAALALAGCAALQATPPTAVHQPMSVRPEPRTALASQPGSIFQPNFSRPLFEDRRARFVGDVITVNPGEVHDGAPLADGGRRWTILYLPPALVMAAAEDIAPGTGARFEFSQPVYRLFPLAQRLRGLVAAGGETGAEEEGLLALLAPLLRPESRPLGTPRALLRVRDWIDAEPEADVPLAELAAQASLSRFQLVRSFARLTGLTPHAYRLQRRVQAARRLILDGTPLADAAAASGFSDQSHMTRLFRRVYGLSPGAFAKV